MDNEECPRCALDIAKGVGCSLVVMAFGVLLMLCGLILDSKPEVMSGTTADIAPSSEVLFCFQHGLYRVRNLNLKGTYRITLKQNKKSHQAPLRLTLNSKRLLYTEADLILSADCLGNDSCDAGLFIERKN